MNYNLIINKSIFTHGHIVYKGAHIAFYIEFIQKIDFII